MPPLLLAAIEAGLLSQADADTLARQLDPELARAWAEQLLEQRFTGALSAQQSRLIELIRASDFKPTAAQLNTFWDKESELLWADVGPDVLDIVSERAAVSAVTAGINWEKINQSVIDWAEDYYINADLDIPGSVGQLNLTARTQFQKAFVQWQRGELENVVAEGGLPQLIDALIPTFGPVRASRIATTETTRLFSQTTLFVERANEDTTHFRFFTANDELVCPICAPLNGKVVEKNSSGFGGIGWPPLHVNCRCEISAETALTLAADEPQAAPDMQPEAKFVARLSSEYTPDQLEAIWEEVGTWEADRRAIARQAVDDITARRSPFDGMIFEKETRVEGIASYRFLDDRVALVNNFATRASGGREMLSQLQNKIKAEFLEFHATVSARSYYERIGAELVPGTANVYRWKAVT